MGAIIDDLILLYSGRIMNKIKSSIMGAIIFSIPYFLTCDALTMDNNLTAQILSRYIGELLATQ